LCCRLPLAWAAPGQGSDAPAELALIDTWAGSIIGRQGLEMVQMMESPSWTSRRVTIGGYVDLPLPRGRGSPAGRAEEGQRGRDLYYEEGRIIQEREPNGTWH